MSDNTKYHDNTMVRRLKWGYQYLAITFQDPKEPIWPYAVSISCYCVPGRIDSYRFEWVPGKPGIMERTTFCSEGHVNLPKALKMLHIDLNKPRVVALVKEAVAKEDLIRYSRIFIGLLAEIAPQSKAYRAGNRVLLKVIKARRERLQNEKESKQHQETPQGTVPPGGSERPASVSRSHPGKPERSGGTRAAA